MERITEIQDGLTETRKNKGAKHHVRLLVETLRSILNYRKNPCLRPITIVQQNNLWPNTGVFLLLGSLSENIGIC
jgi:hypothetical protein